MDMDLDHIVRQVEKYGDLGRALEPPGTQRQALFAKVQGYADRFLDRIGSLKAYETDGHEKCEADGMFEPQEEGGDLDRLLDHLALRVDGPGLNPASGGHLGYIPGGGVPAAAWGDLLAAITNRYAGVFYSSPGAVRMENAMVRWSARLVGYPENAGGCLLSGGSMANLTAVATARSAMGLKGRDLERAVVYLTHHAHHSLHKALRITGLGECIVRYVPMDHRYRMRADALRDMIGADERDGLRPFLLIANAGSTDVGAVDPLDELASVAAKHGVWYHVDAAYGGYFLLTDHGRSVMVGIHRADSLVMDPHKGLFLPYGTGIVLLKDIRHLMAAHGYQAHYMQDTRERAFEPSPAELSPELSKHFRGLRMWLPLKLHGVAPFRACLEEKLWLARYFRHRVAAIGFATGPEPDLSVVHFRLETPEADPEVINRDIARAVVKDGRVFISTTLLDGRFTLRFAALSFRTHREQVDVLLEQLELLARAAATGSGAQPVH